MVTPGKGLGGAGGGHGQLKGEGGTGEVWTMSLCPLARGNLPEPSLTRLPVPQLGRLREGGFPWPPVPAGGRGVPGLEALGRLRQRAGVPTADTDGEGGGGTAWGQSQCAQGQPNPPGPTPSSSPKGSWAWPETPKLITHRGLGTQSRSRPPWGPGLGLRAPRAPGSRSLPLTDRGPRRGLLLPAGFLRPGAGPFRGHGLRGGRERGAERGAARHAAGRLRHRHPVHPRAERRVSVGTGDKEGGGTDGGALSQHPRFPCRWVAYEGTNFSGEQYVLEKGVYRNCEDWGAGDCRIASVQPILQVRAPGTPPLRPAGLVGARLP